MFRIFYQAEDEEMQVSDQTQDTMKPALNPNMIATLINSDY
jgi:hypothetical protein